MEEQKNTYAKGLFFNKVHEKTSDEVRKWKKGSIATHIDSHIAYLESLKEYADEKGYVRHDLTKNTKRDTGETFFSFRLNTYKPSQEKMDEVKKDLSEDIGWD